MWIILTIAGLVLAAVAVVAVLCKIFYKVADANEALVITGGKELVIKPSGGAFVIPIFRKAQYFPLNMRTINSDKDEIKTSTSVPIFIDWTAQIRPKKDDPELLAKAVTSFLSMKEDGINDNIKQTLTGTVQDIASSMTPLDVLKNKEDFKKKVEETVADEMSKMGMELVSLNIREISDPNGYFNNIAAIDMADKKLAAENKEAVIDQEIREQKAESEKAAKQRELASELAIAENERSNNLRMAEIKIETDKANADAAIAGELQSTIRRQEVVEQEGKVEVVRQEQNNLAALKEKEVEITRAETRKEQAKIDADSSAQVKKITADTEVAVAEREAKAVTIEAEAKAQKTIKEGTAEADIVVLKGKAEAEAKKAMLVAEAEAEKERMLAEAEGAKAKGLAEAEAIEAKLLAEAKGEGEKLKAQAEGEKQLAEARASNDKVNLEIEKAKIFAGMQVEIATNTATIMAKIGENAEFVNIGGAGTGNGGNVLIDTMMQVPAMMKTLNAQNDALNGQPFNEELRKLGEAIFGPAKGLLSNHETTNITPPATEEVNVADDAE